MDDSLLDVTGVGPATAQLLAEAGFTSVASIANAEPEALAMVRGIGAVRAASLRTAAQQLLAGSEPVSTAVASGGPTKREERAKRAERLRKQAKQLRKQARQLTKKAESTKSKKKRKRRLREAAKLEAAAKKARQKSKKLLAK
jgi:NAD-dependent DNA ligase